MQQTVQLIAYVGMAIGLVGVILPLIPGAALIWLSALLWAWADGFERVGWATLVVLAFLVIAAEIADVLLASYGARRGGASWRGLFFAGLGAVIGFLLLNLLGALVGAAVGMVAWEAFRRNWDWGMAWRASRGLLFGYMLSMIVKFSMAALMLAIFIWQAFF
ncbi:MAG: DUF456 domain-containing protein [Chloroflexi bacterium]|nr:DUF456 domain-containing protein [Chloroflexota bacterium]